MGNALQSGMSREEAGLPSLDAIPIGRFVLETHGFSDAPNAPTFPSMVVRPGEMFRSTIVYRFGAR